MPAQTTAPSLERPFCSLVSKGHGEDPIGFAIPYDAYLLLELPTPWPYSLWDSRHMPAGLQKVVERAQAAGLRLRFLAFAPEAGGGEAGRRRLMYFRKPAGMFARLERREYLLPEAEVAALAAALLEPEADASAFDTYLQDTGAVRDLLVCTHGSVDRCCAKFGFPVYERLKREFSDAALRVHRVSHFGGHRFAPTLLDLPEARYWAYLTPELLAPLATRSGEVSRFAGHYRGWGGVGALEQVAEREMFVREGWAWTDYLKESELLELWGGDGQGLELPAFADDPPDGARLRLRFASPDGRVRGRYEATVERSGVVEALEGGCGLVAETPKMMKVHQFRVTRLERTLEPSPKMERSA